MTEPIRYAPDGHVAVITLARPEKRNAFSLAMLAGLAEAYTQAEADPEIRVLLVVADGAHFTAGLDLAEVGPAVAAGGALFPGDAERIDPLGLRGRHRTKPVVVAIGGYCLTIGIELALASDVIVASESARFGQFEVGRGIFPFGGATFRMPARLGWHDAMRWLLTGELFDAKEAHRIGLVQEVAPEDTYRDRARAIADGIARAAPLGVLATLRNAWLAEREGEAAANAALLAEARALMATEDAAEGMQSFLERRAARFRGR